MTKLTGHTEHCECSDCYRDEAHAAGRAAATAEIVAWLRTPTAAYKPSGEDLFVADAIEAGQHHNETEGE